MRKIFIAVILLSTLNACHRSCDCSPYEICLEGKCICGEWTEGTSCTPMRNKFVGTYAGILTINSVPSADTLAIYAGNDQMTNYTFLRTTPLPYPARLSGIRIFTPYTGVFFASILLPEQSNIYLDNFHPVDCGSAQLSPDGQNLTMTYHPLSDTTILDFSHTYVFTGRKQ